MSCTGFANYQRFIKIKSVIDIVGKMNADAGETVAELYTEYLRVQPYLPKFEDIINVYKTEKTHEQSLFKFDEAFVKSTELCVLDERLESIDLLRIGQDEKAELKIRAVESSGIGSNMKRKYVSEITGIECGLQ